MHKGKNTGAFIKINIVLFSSAEKKREAFVCETRLAVKGWDCSLMAKMKFFIRTTRFLTQ